MQVAPAATLPQLLHYQQMRGEHMCPPKIHTHAHRGNIEVHRKTQQRISGETSTIGVAGKVAEVCHSRGKCRSKSLAPVMHFGC